MRVLVFGGWGQLGTDLAAVAERRYELVRPTHADVDVTQGDKVANAVTSSQPDAVVNAAAFHKVELCEEQPVASFSVNAVGALNVARACRQEGVRCVYVSTDYVFAGEAVSVVDDQFFSPTATRDMAERIFLLLEREAPPGIYHLANAGSCSWFLFARAIYELAGIEADLSPRPAGEQSVRRPRSSVLLDTKTAALGLPTNRRWEEALHWYLESRPARLADAVGRERP